MGRVEWGTGGGPSCSELKVMIIDLGRGWGLAGTMGVERAVEVASWVGLKSRSRSGLGAGEIGRDGADGGDAASGAFPEPMFSNRARSDDTGFWRLLVRTWPIDRGVFIQSTSRQARPLWGGPCCRRKCFAMAGVVRGSRTTRCTHAEPSCSSRRQRQGAWGFRVHQRYQSRRHAGGMLKRPWGRRIGVAARQRIERL